MLMVLLARFLQKELFGQYGFASSYVLLFGSFIGLGFSVICIREISRRLEDASKIITAALVPMIVSSMVVVMLIGLSVYISKSGQVTIIMAVLIMAFDLVVNNMAAIFDSVARAHERMLYSVIPNVIKNVILLIAYLIFLPRDMGLVGVCLLVMCASMLKLILHIIFCRKVFNVVPFFGFNMTLSRQLLIESFPMAMTSTFIVIYYKIDTVMLSYMRNDAEVGLYMAASTLAFAMVFISSNFQQAIFPILSKLYVDAKNKMQSVYRQSFKYLCMLGLPIASGLCVVAPRIIILVYGEPYLGAVLAMQILCCAMLLMFVNGLMGYALITVNGQVIFMKIVAVGASLNIFLNMVLIPRYGIAGAAFATVVAEANANIICWIVLSRRYGVSASLTDILRSALCCAIMTVFVIFVSPYMCLPLVIISGAVVYVVGLFVFKAVGDQELMIIKGFLRGISSS